MLIDERLKEKQHLFRWVSYLHWIEILCSYIFNSFKYIYFCIKLKQEISSYNVRLEPHPMQFNIIFIRVSSDFVLKKCKKLHNFVKLVMMHNDERWMRQGSWMLGQIQTHWMPVPWQCGALWPSKTLFGDTHNHYWGESLCFCLWSLIFLFNLYQ